MTSLTRRGLLASGASLGALAFAPQAFAQVNDKAPNVDAMLAMHVLIVGRKEIAVCEAALAQLRDEDLRRFAQAEVEEHQHMKKTLGDLGYVLDVTDMDGQELQRAAADRATRVAFVAEGQAIPISSSDPLTLCYEISQQCIATAKAEMAKIKSNTDFDRRFAECQLDTHYGLFDQVVVFHKHAQTKLADVLAVAKTDIEQHIVQCKELRMKLA